MTENNEEVDSREKMEVDAFFALIEEWNKSTVPEDD